MKKYLIAISLMLTTLVSVPTLAQTAGTQAVDSTQVDEVEVFSDTTQTDSAAVVPPVHVQVDDDFDMMVHELDPETISRILDYVSSWLPWGVLTAVIVGLILVFLFVVLPIIILALIIYAILKHRNDRMKLAEMAIRSGKTIPKELVEPAPESNDELWNKGIRQALLGVGLAFFLGFMMGKLGIGIGVLVMCIGIGNLLISRSSRKANRQSAEEIIEESNNQIKE